MTVENILLQKNLNGIMQTYVVDIQSLYNREHHMIPKELTIMSLETPFQSHWVIKSPHEHYQLPVSIRNVNRRLTRLGHGLEWSDGESEWGKVELFLHRLAHTAIKVYANGKTAVEFLETFMSCYVLDISKIAPPVSTLPDIDDQCMLHGIDRQEKYTCSYNHTKRLRRWLIENPHEYEEIPEPIYEAVL